MGDAHPLAAFCEQGAHADDFPGHDDRTVVQAVALRQQFADVARAGLLQGAAKAVHRAAGEVNAQQFPLLLQQIALAEDAVLRQVAQHLVGHPGLLAKHVRLTDFVVAVPARAEAQQAFAGGQQSTPLAKIAQGAHRGQALQRTATRLAQVHPFAKVLQVLEPAVPLPRFDHLLQRAGAGAANGGQAEADAAPAAVVGLDVKVQAAVIDVRRQHGDAEATAFIHVAGDAAGVIPMHAQQGAHVFLGIVTLEEGRLQRDDGVVRRMGLVEAIVGEEGDVVENLAGHPFVDAVLRPALQENLAVLHEIFLALVGDGLAHRVALRQFVAEKLRGDLHNLFLIHDDAAGLLQNGLQRLMVVGDLLFPAQASVVGGDVVHRPGAVERDAGDDVLEAPRPHVAQHELHAFALHLKHADRLPPPQQGEGLVQHSPGLFVPLDHLVPERDVLHGVGDALMLEDQVAGAAQNGQRRQPQKIDFQQADRFAGLHRELRHRANVAAFAAARGPVQGNGLDQRPVADDDAGGVRRHVAADALQRLRGVQNAPDLLVAARHVLEFGRGLHVLRQGFGTGLLRNQPRDMIDPLPGNLQRAAHVPHRRPRPQGAEGDDGGDLVLAVFARRVTDHFRAAVVGIVQIDVRHADATGIQKAFEDQAILNRVDFRDAQAPGRQAARARTAHVPPDVRLARELAEVPHDEEVGVETHVMDQAQFMVQPRHQTAVLRRPLAQAPAQPLFAELSQPALRVMAGRHRKGGQLVALHVQVQLTHFRDQQGVFQRLALVDLAEGRPHLLRRRQVIAGVGHPHTVLVRLARPGLDAQQGVVRVVIALMHVVYVVGGQQRRAEPLAILHQPAIDLAQFRDVVMLQLQEEVLAAKDVLVPADKLARGLLLTLHQQRRDFAGEAARGGDQAIGVPGQEVAVDARVVVEALQLGGGGDFQQIAVAPIVARQQQQMRGPAVQRRVAVAHAARRQVGLHADDRMDAFGPAGAVEVDRAEHRPVIADGQRAHAQFGGARHQIVDATQPVQQRKLAVDVKMHKVFAGHKAPECASRAPVYHPGPTAGAA